MRGIKRIQVLSVGIGLVLACSLSGCNRKGELIPFSAISSEAETESVRESTEALTGASLNETGVSLNQIEASSKEKGNSLKQTEEAFKEAEASMGENEDSSRASSSAGGLAKESASGGGKIGKEDCIQVYVCGAVNTPDVYALPPGSRVNDAVEAAGDLRNMLQWHLSILRGNWQMRKWSMCLRWRSLSKSKQKGELRH